MGIALGVILNVCNMGRELGELVIERGFLIHHQHWARDVAPTGLELLYLD